MRVMVVLLAEGLSASVEIREGDPRRILRDEAREWAADSIFVGSHGLDHLDERSGLGSVAAALVTDAACSVEVMRSGLLMKADGGECDEPDLYMDYCRDDSKDDA